MRELALPARLAHMVAEAAKQAQAGMAAELAVLMTERGLGGDSVDLERRLARFRTERGRARNRREGAGRAAGKAGVARRLPARATGQPPARCCSTPGRTAWPRRGASADDSCWPTAAGRELDAADPLAGEPFLVVADLQGKAQKRAHRLGRGGRPRTISAPCLATVSRRRTESAFDPAKRSVRVRETARLGAIVLAERMLPAPSGDAADRAILAAIREHGLSLLPWSKEAETLRHRLSWLHRGLGDALAGRVGRGAARVAGGLAAALPRRRGVVRALSTRRCPSGLMSLVPHDLQRRIGALAPTHFDAPSGSRVPIRYDGEWPVLAIRVQELFGLDRHPSIADGTVPLTLELLSPAHRPIQTTRDLPGFWRGSWADVRADMRGRYPRHVWPDDPLPRRRPAAPSRARNDRATSRVRPVV